ncbi:MAG: hypothetical protein RL027_4 [Pseudomonadota bacterium]|jgi:hypothetical protein
MSFLPPQTIIDLTDKIIKLESKANLSEEEKLILKKHQEERENICRIYNSSKISSGDGFFSLLTGFALGNLL